MELIEIKNIWNDLHGKIEDNNEFSKAIVMNIIKQKSKGGLEKIKNSIVFSILFTFLFLIFIASVFWGNPFDYQNNIFYLPAMLYAILGLFTLGLLIKEFSFVKGVNLYTGNLLDTLKLVILSRKRFNRTGQIILINSFIVSLSFGISLVWRTSDENLLNIISVMGLSVISAFLTFVAAKYLGFFKDKGLQDLKESLMELEDERLV